MYASIANQGGITNSNSKIQANAALDMVRLEYKRQKINDASDEDAMKAGWELVRSSYKLYQGTNDSAVAIPNGYDAVHISKYLDGSLPTTSELAYKKFSMVDQYNLKLDNGVSKEDYDKADYRWVGNNSGDGVYLSLKGKGIMRNTKNEKVEIKYSDMETMEVPFDRDASSVSLRAIFRR